MQKQLADILTIHHYVLNLFPYWDDSLLKQWNERVIELITKINLKIDLKLFYQELTKLSAILNDGHTMVYLPTNIKKDIKYSPVRLAIVQKELVIASGDRQYKNYFNQPIKTINKIEKSAFLDKVKVHFWPSNPNFSMQLTNFNSSFFFEDEQLIIEFIDGKKITISFLDSPWIEPIENNLKIDSEYKTILNSDSLSIYQVNNKVVVKINHFMSKDVVTNFYKYIAELKDANEIIFDVRNNFGGNSGFADEISQAFFNDALVMEKSFRQVIDAEDVASASMQFYDGDTLKSSEFEMYQKLHHQFLETRTETNLYEGYQGVLNDQVVTIIQNELTYSSAENFVINFDNKKRATLIGQRTAGSTGQPAWLKLETGGMFMITAKKVLYPNGTLHHNLGIKPDIVMEEKLADRIEGKDKLLMFALKKHS